MQQDASIFYLEHAMMFFSKKKKSGWLMAKFYNASDKFTLSWM